MHRILLALAVVFCGGVAFAEDVPPQWIWSSAEAQPDEVVYFRHAFDLRQPAGGRIAISCDNEYRLYVNGRMLGSESGDAGWQQAEGFDISEVLVAGRNVVAVQARNLGGPAALIANVTVREGDRETSQSTGSAWKCTQQGAAGWHRVDFDDASWQSATALGEIASTAPWGAQLRMPADYRAIAARRPQAGTFELVDGDRVVLLGGTFIERDQRDGYIETALTRAFPDADVAYRNLGWSGDTVFGHARAAFDTVEDGYLRLVEHVAAVQPTAILVAYGANESWEGEAGLLQFIAGLERLFTDLEATGARIVVLSPLLQENLGPPLPDPTVHNREVLRYRDALRDAAGQREYLFVDLTDAIQPDVANDAAPLTDNGIHLTPAGYLQAARHLERALGIGQPAWRVELSDSEQIAAPGTTVSAIQRTKQSLEFEALDAAVPLAGRTLQVAGLSPGDYSLSVDGRTVARASASAWRAGVTWHDAERDPSEGLRREILAKNDLYFHRWRPQNETYLFGFRKHEQGNNAVEIPQFDPLVAAKEAEIAVLRRPQPRRYELNRVGDDR